jgi:hypothetical protein
MPYPLSRMLWSLRRVLWWLDEKILWPLVDTVQGVRGADAFFDATGERAPVTRVSASSSQLRAISLVCLAVAVAASATILLVYQSHFTFLLDEWRFLLDRQGSSVAVYLDPHIDHIAVAPVAIYKALLAVFGMDSARPFQIVSTCIFLLSAILLFIYLRRRVGDWAALLGTVLILFLGAGWNALLWPFQIGLTGAVAAGIGALLALDREDRRGDVVACVLLVVSTSFSELGVMFSVGAFVVVALGPAPRRSRLYVAVVPLLLYGLWYVGWGHEGQNEASFHNLVNSPKYVFDSVAQNLASLLGLAAPLDGQTGPYVDGLTWGRILLVVAIALAIWRLRRAGPPSRWLWAVLAAGAAFWFLSALNAVPVIRTPTTGRYQYPGAIFVLLIAAELLRGVRIDKRLLAAATVVTVAAAVSGVFFLHDGYRLRTYMSDIVRAQLAAVEIGRGHESGELVNDDRGLVIPDASAYFSAVDDFGSPAFSESQLAASGEGDRVAADQLLASAEGIKLGAVAQPARATGTCQKAHGSQSGSAALTVGPGNYALRSGGKASGATAQAGAPVEAARFADRSSVTLGFVNPGAGSALSIPADHSTRPWRLFLPAGSVMSLCQLSGAPSPAPSPATPPASASNAVPDLAGVQLDQAEWVLGTLGIRFRTVGGALRPLEITATRNYTVCRTIPGAGARPKGTVDMVLCPGRTTSGSGD